MRTTLKTRLWLNVALVVIAVILAAILYFKPGEKKSAPPALLTQLQNAEVHDIKIAQPGVATIELARKGGTWQMTAPSKMRADQSQVQSLLDSLRTDVKSSFTAPASDLTKYGLAPPQLQLWLNGTEFDLGNTEPVDHYRYVLSGGQVHLINGMLFYRASHRPYWWASKRLLPEGATISAIQLPNATLTLKDAKWQITPAAPTVTTDAIQALVENWQDAQAIGTEKLGAGKPDGEVAIQVTGESTPIRFAILKDPNLFVLARPDLDIEYQLASSQRAGLLSFQSPVKSPASATAKVPAAATTKAATRTHWQHRTTSSQQPPIIGALQTPVRPSPARLHHQPYACPSYQRLKPPAAASNRTCADKSSVPSLCAIVTCAGRYQERSSRRCPGNASKASRAAANTCC